MCAFIVLYVYEYILYCMYACIYYTVCMRAFIVLYICMHLLYSMYKYILSICVTCIVTKLYL